MRPDDANIVGNVHGGIILKMIEEAGCIVGTRHCNTQNGVRVQYTFRPYYKLFHGTFLKKCIPDN